MLEKHTFGKLTMDTWTASSRAGNVNKQFAGAWRIIELEGYESDYIDLCGPATLKITTNGTGHFNFGAVEAETDSKMDNLDERVLRFTFEGNDEGDPFFGRGYCLVDGDELTGRLFRHHGDEFGFKATRSPKYKKPRAPRPSAPAPRKNP